MLNNKNHFNNNILKKIGIGTSAFGSRVSYSNSIKILNLFFDNDVNYIDTSPFYGFGQSEKIIGNTFSTNRNDVFISTKFGLRIKSNLIKRKLIPWARKLYYIPGLRNHINNNKIKIIDESILNIDEISKSINNSLINLRTNYLDQLLIHNNINYYLNNNEVIDYLLELKNKNIISNLGVTTHHINPTISELITKNNDWISTVQLPYKYFNNHNLKSKNINYFSIFSEIHPDKYSLINNIKKNNGYFLVLITNPKNFNDYIKYYFD